MTRDSVVWFTRETYAAHQALDPEGMQLSFDEWLNVIEASLEQLKGKGFFPKRVVIDPDDFVTWCRNSGSKIDGAARSDFAQFIGKGRNLH